MERFLRRHRPPHRQGHRANRLPCGAAHGRQRLRNVEKAALVRLR